MDKRAMIAEIAARHGVRLDPDDPAFLLVELNQMAFEEKEAELKAQMVEVENLLVGLIGHLQKAGDVYQEQIKAYTDALGESIAVKMADDARAAKARLTTESGEAIQDALMAAERSFQTLVRKEVSVPIADLLWAQKQSFWKNIWFSLGSALIGGMVVLAGVWSHIS